MRNRITQRMILNGSTAPVDRVTRRLMIDEEADRIIADVRARALSDKAIRAAEAVAYDHVTHGGAAATPRDIVTAALDAAGIIGGSTT